MDSFRYFSIKNIFNTYFRSIASQYIPQCIFCIRLRLLPAMHWDDFCTGKTINVSFEEFKGKDDFFVREWLRQKGLEKLCEIFES